MRASMEFAAQAKESERERERGAAQRESEANTNAALQVQLSLSLSLTIHKAAYLLHNGKTTIERANTHIHTCIHMYPHPWDTKPAKPSVRSTHCVTESRTNEPKPKRSEPNHTEQRRWRWRWCRRRCCRRRRVVCIAAVKERCRCRCQGRTVPENGRVAWMNDSRTQTHTRTTAADGCRKKGANGDVSVSVAALCYCVGSKLS